MTQPAWVAHLFNGPADTRVDVDIPAGPGYTTPDGQSALDGITKRLARATEGTRNGLLNWAAWRAGQLNAAGHLDADIAHAAIQAAAYACGLGEPEVRNTMRSGWAAGKQHPVPPRPRTVVDAAYRFSYTPPDVDTETGEIIEGERTSWWPRDLGDVLDGGHTEPEPTHLARDDGYRLVYAGKVNGLLGESESGKTWVGLLAVAQALQVGETVAYLDFEDSAPGIIDRLRTLGVNRSELDRFTYIGPDEALHPRASADLWEAVTDLAPTLTVVDGVNAAMTLAGLDLMSNRDATAFSQVLLKPLARTGSAVLTIDHLPKNPDQRGKGGIGAQAKRADITGCGIGVQVVTPFGRGMTGRLKLTVDKDRPGHVRARSAGAHLVGQAVLESVDGRVTIHIEAPQVTEPGQPFRPTTLMVRVSSYLATCPDGASTRAIEDGVSGNRDYVNKALNQLVSEGYVERQTAARGAIIHRLVRPFFDNDSVTI